MSPGRGFRVSSWAIRHPIPVAVLFIALIVAGLISYNALAIKNFPNISFPAVTVTITRNGAAPAEMETQVTRPIENALAGLSNVENINSTDTQGQSVTFIQFYLGEDLQKAYDEVRAKVDETRSVLPRDIDPPIVNRVEFEDQPIITYAVSAPAMSEADLSWFIDDTISRTLQAQPGVARIDRVGGVDREINVLIDPVRLAERGLTAAQVNDALTSADVNSPGGMATIGNREATIRVLGQATTVAGIRNLEIPAAGGQFVRLSDVADVGDGSAEVRSFALLDGKPVVGFQVTKTKLSSEVSVEDAVDAAIAKLNRQYPGMTIHKIVSQVDDTRRGFAATEHTLLEGMLLAAFVVWLFLRDWRATAVTAVAMPASLIPTFAFMHLLGFSLNLVTLLGLTLVIGILVDDAIVEIENIEKRVYGGLRPFDAAIEGADQIGLAVVACTFSIAAVFLPVGFMPGIPGQFFKEFGITVTVAVLFSLVVARLLTPLLAAYFLKPKLARVRHPLPAFYTRTLFWALDHRWATIAIGGVIFVISIFLAIPLPKGVQPPANGNYFYVNVEAPPGSTVADMRVLIDRIDALLARQPETRSVFAAVGGGGGGGPGSISVGSAGITSGAAVAILNNKRSTTLTQIQDRIRGQLRDLPDGRFTFNVAGFGASGVRIILTSETGEHLEAAGLELMREMRSLPGLADPRPETPPSGAEIYVRPRWDEAARLGVSADAIGQATRIATVGDIDANVAKLDQGQQRIPIRVRLPAEDRSNLAVIRNLRLPTAGGGTTTLESVADVGFEAGPAEIDRFDRKRNLIIDADLTGGAQLGDMLPRVEQLPILRHPPPGVGQASQGQEQALGQLATGFAVALFSGIGLVYAVMVLLFQSFFKPFVILSALPTAIAGAFLAMLLVNAPLSIPSAIGFLMLMGLAAKNSILLVEYAIERERAGATQREALFEACRERARPIVMTTVAMAAGMLPTALALGSGSEFRQPMAVAVIGGLITSTALSLVIVPVVYEFIDDFEHWLMPRIGRLVTPRDAPSGPPAPAPQEAG
ncbi:MAG TPA: efflux RND transporter permease subunit [Caulobacteraceae bacterium]|nr:efflux RND transporter permease subunit [Caulobacteraceae bacterium]